MPSAYHGSNAAKQALIARLVEHRDAGHIKQETKFNPATRCGCAIGCALNAYDHAGYAETLGLHPALPYIIEAIFENLPPTLATQFAVDAPFTIPVGADTSAVPAQLAMFVIDKLFEKLVGITGRDAMRTVLNKHTATANGFQSAEAKWTHLHKMLKALESQARQNNNATVSDILGTAADSTTATRVNPAETSGYATYLYTAFVARLIKPEDVAKKLIDLLYEAPMAQAPILATPAMVRVPQPA